jgi:hypothetical protein
MTRTPTGALSCHMPKPPPAPTIWQARRAVSTGWPAQPRPMGAAPMTDARDLTLSLGGPWHGRYGAAPSRPALPAVVACGGSRQTCPSTAPAGPARHVTRRRPKWGAMPAPGRSGGWHEGRPLRHPRPFRFPHGSGPNCLRGRRGRDGGRCVPEVPGAKPPGRVARRTRQGAGLRAAQETGATQGRKPLVLAMVRPGPVLHVWREGQELARLPLDLHGALALAQALLREVHADQRGGRSCAGQHGGR